MKIVCKLSTGLKHFENHPSPHDILLKYKLSHVVKTRIRPFGSEGFGSVDFECSEPYYSDVVSALTECGIRPVTPRGFLDRKEAVYTRAELDTAELLEAELDLHPAAKFANDDPQVDLSVPGCCSYCWSGARLVPDVAVKLEKRSLRSAVNQMYEGDRWFVDEGVRNALLKAGVSRRDLVRAAGITGKKQIELRYIIEPTATLPRLAPSTRGIEQSTNPKQASCPVCARDGFFGNNDALLLAMKRTLVEPIIEESNDRAFLVSTWEHFGIGVRPGRPKRFFPKPMLVVNQAARRVLMAATTAKFRWAPIQLID